MFRFLRVILFSLVHIVCVNGYIWHTDSANVSFHFKYKLIRIYISLTVCLTWFACCCCLCFFSFLLFFSILTHWKWFQEQLYALRHAWYCEKSPIIIIIIFDDDGGDLIRSIFFWVGVFQAIFFSVNYYRKRVFVLRFRELLLEFLVGVSE